jgi:hypothetical protein
VCVSVCLSVCGVWCVCAGLCLLLCSFLFLWPRACPVALNCVRRPNGSPPTNTRLAQARLIRFNSLSRPFQPTAPHKTTEDNEKKYKLTKSLCWVRALCHGEKSLEFFAVLAAQPPSSPTGRWPPPTPPPRPRETTTQDQTPRRGGRHTQTNNGNKAKKTDKQCKQTTACAIGAPFVRFGGDSMVMVWFGLRAGRTRNSDAPLGPLPQRMPSPVLGCPAAVKKNYGRKSHVRLARHKRDLKTCL